MARAQSHDAQQYIIMTEQRHQAESRMAPRLARLVTLGYHPQTLRCSGFQRSIGDAKVQWPAEINGTGMSAGRGQVGREFGEEMSVKQGVNRGLTSKSHHPSRREILILGAGAVAASTTAFNAGAQTAADTEHHGLSAFGDLGYPANFTQLKYVNPSAPKGGTFSQLAGGGTATFNSFNGFILKGDAAMDMEQTFAALMWRAFDEPDAVYGYAADKVSASADNRVYKFHLRDGIAFHDGSPIKAEDVAFSLTTFKEKGHPAIASLLRDMEAAETEGDRVVVVKFAAVRARSAPLTVANLPILSKAYYTAHAFDETSMEPPLGSGPYKVGKFEQGRVVEFERVKDWWGEKLPIMRGQNNFDVLRYEYFRDRDTAFEAFTSKTYNFREEFTSRVWATRYDFPALKDGRVKKETLPDERPSGMQAWMINTRREKFQDVRLREALAYAFDFEWANKNLMFDSYARTESCFQGSDLMAKGKPSREELALLDPHKGTLPAEVFGEAWAAPVSDGSGMDRRLMRRAAELLNVTGWTVKDGKRVNARGEPLTIEFLAFERVSEPHHALYIKNLTALGIDASVRVVDPVQYRSRMQDFDFDMSMNRIALPLTPGDGLRGYFSSKTANAKGAPNFSGISSGVVDTLVERAIAAPDRVSLNTACRALDRVLRADHYWVAGWYKPSHWIAYWDMFGRPAAKPRYARGTPETWWTDADKAAKLGG
jgi:microcin C transport system substrate-binding protein